MELEANGHVAAPQTSKLSPHTHAPSEHPEPRPQPPWRTGRMQAMAAIAVVVFIFMCVQYKATATVQSTSSVFSSSLKLAAPDHTVQKKVSGKVIVWDSVEKKLKDIGAVEYIEKLEDTLHAIDKAVALKLPFQAPDVSALHSSVVGAILLWNSEKKEVEQMDAHEYISLLEAEIERLSPKKKKKQPAKSRRLLYQ